MRAHVFRFFFATHRYPWSDIEQVCARLGPVGGTYAVVRSGVVKTHQFQRPVYRWCMAKDLTKVSDRWLGRRVTGGDGGPDRAWHPTEGLECYVVGVASSGKVRCVFCFFMSLRRAKQLFFFFCRDLRPFSEVGNSRRRSTLFNYSRFYGT